VLAIGFAGLGLTRLQRIDEERRLLGAAPNDVPSHPAWVRLAVDQARPLFARECAGCHGGDMKGHIATGAPNLTDQNWLYGDGSVFQIERTILYGIRSDRQKSRNITEMPAYGLRGQLSDADIRNLVQYVLQLSGQPNDAQAAIQGRAVYNGQGGCFDCHAADARGNSDYGAPDLTANSWLYGGDPQSLYNSIYSGRHGMMPAWIGKLTLEQIRALAVYIYVASHH
jgi:cytochrome c oxidase cbb3-type subunit 3